MLMLGTAFALLILVLAQVPANTADGSDTNAPDFAAIDRYVEEEMEATLQRLATEAVFISSAPVSLDGPLPREGEDNPTSKSMDCWIVQLHRDFYHRGRSESRERERNVFGRVLHRTRRLELLEG